MGEEAFELSSDAFVPVDLQEVDRDVFVTPFLTRVAAERVLGEGDGRIEAAVDASGRGTAQPESGREEAVLLEKIGLAALVDTMLLERPEVQGVLSQRFASVGGGSIDHHHSYLVDYGREGDDELGFHVDDSEVTLNLCLGETFSGAELVMLGRRCDRHRQTEVLAGETFEIEHEPGALVIHAGRHRHRVDPIRTGRRRNLIAWLRSSSYRAAVEADPASAALTGASHPEWCGWPS